MKASDELPPLLWPFTPREIYAFVLGGACFAFAEPRAPEVELVVEDIRAGKSELAAALRSVRGPRLSPANRQRAAARVVELRDELVKKHLRLRGMSLGFRASPSAPVHLWP